MPDRSARLQRQFGSRVREARRARNLTQAQLAAAARLSETYVGEIERGERMVSLETIVRLAAALGGSGAELLASAQL